MSNNGLSCLWKQICQYKKKRHGGETTEEQETRQGEEKPSLEPSLIVLKEYEKILYPWNKTRYNKKGKFQKNFWKLKYDREREQRKWMRKK